MSKEKLKALMGEVKKEGPNIIFSLISAWLLVLSVIQIIFSFIPKYRTITEGGEEKEELYYLYQNVVPEFSDAINIVLFVLIVIAVAVALYLMNRFWLKKSLFIILPISFLFYGMLSIALPAATVLDRGFWAFIFSALAILVFVVCINYARSQKIPLPTKDISSKASLTIVITAFVVLSSYWTFLLWARTATYNAPCFDMGIFAQAYDNIVDPSHHFLPITTCERGEELSHFAVHFSPILYLLAPFCFFIEPLPVLVVAQIVLVLSGVFPIYLICREIKLSNLKTTLISLLFLIYPVMSSGSFYDFHENAFLAPLILWTLYFSHKKKWYHTLLMFVFALLVLMVKEDAAIYVAFISLYIFFGRKRYASGASMFIMTVAYFFFAIAMISHFQQNMFHGAEGNMLSSRYANIIGDEAGFMSLIKVFIVDPALYITESLTSNKLFYILNMFLPLAFLPIITRKPSRWLLLGPIYILNLVTDYPYQHDIGYQYSFGSGALLVYLAAINLADLSNDVFFPVRETAAPVAAENAAIAQGPSEKPSDAVLCCEAESSNSEPATESAPVEPLRPYSKNVKVRFVSYLAAIALLFAVFASLFVQAARAPYHFYYARRLVSDTQSGDLNTIDDVLSRVDRSKSILASSGYLTHLYDADELYSTLQVFTEGNTIVRFTDIAVLDLRGGEKENSEERTRKYLLYGYKITEEGKDANGEVIIRVLERTEASPEVGYSKSYLAYLERRAEEEKAKQENAEQNDAEQNNAEQNAAEQENAEQNDAEQNDAEQENAEQE